jgi:hypothetical protein
MNPAIHGAIIAAKKRQQEEEEQKLTQYNSEDLNGWEFKIVHSTFGRFRNSEVIRQLMEEEARNGWEMVEKFDDYRIRFKRRTDKRAINSGGGVDPYRTNYGTGQRVIPFIAVVVALAVAAGILLLNLGSERSSTASPIPYIIFGVIAALVAVVIALRRR